MYGLNLFSFKPKVALPEHILALYKIRSDPIIILELWGKQPNPDSRGSRGLRVLRIPVCSCPLSFSSGLSPALLFSFVLLFCPAKYPPCHVICSIALGATFVSDLSSEITFMFQNLSFCPSAILSPDVTPQRTSDYPCETGTCPVPLHPLGHCWRPSTVPLAP